MDNLPKPEVLIKPAFHKTPLAIFLGILSLAAILVLLNYFNILPLSRLYPKTFGFLPHQNKLQSKVAKPASPVVIACPVPKEFCQKGTIINNGDIFYGIYFTLPEKTSLLAALPGKITDEPKVASRSANQPLLFLRNEEGFEVVYSFYGSSNFIKSKSYSNGAEIGKIGKGFFPSVVPFGGSNFLFSVKQHGKFIKFNL